MPSNQRCLHTIPGRKTVCGGALLLDVIIYLLSVFHALAQFRSAFVLVIDSAGGISSAPTYPLTLQQVLEHMSPVQLAFFDKLNAELAKVESFFIEREDEARTRSSQLRGQLDELKDHRRLFHVTGLHIFFI